MAASDLLAGAKLLSQTLSDKERRVADLLIWKGQQRDYKKWLAGLPISKADQELVLTIDLVRNRLIAGHDIGKRLKSALVVYERSVRAQTRKMLVRGGVDSVHKIRKLPKTMEATFGPGAFEVAAELFTDGLSAEQVRKIYYEKPKLPRKKKTRQ